MSEKKATKDFLSESGHAIAANRMRDVLAISAKIPGVARLDGGRPREELFPIGDRFTFEYRPVDGSTEPTTLSIEIERDATMNYSNETHNGGLPSFIRVAKKLMIEDVHFPSEAYWNQASSIITSGATDALFKVVMLVVGENESVVANFITYPGIMAPVKAMLKTMHGVKSDEFGMNPKSLLDLINSKPTKKPKLLYVVPNGQNPTGSTLPLTRRKEIYAICREHGMLILEDDPYIFLNFKENVKSFLQIDSDYITANPDAVPIVIRADSFSKIIAPGFRTGILTGAKEICDKYRALTLISNWGLSGINQRILQEILTHMENNGGFKKHLEFIRAFYEKRRDMLVSKLKQHIPKDLAKFRIPDHGMFIWLEFTGIEDSLPLYPNMLEHKVSMVPGGCFTLDEKQKSNGFRISFSYVNEEEMERACRSLGVLLLEMHEKEAKLE